MRDFTLALLSAMVVVGFFTTLAYLLHLGSDHRETIYLMVGALISSFTGIVGFWFGSSIGSVRKTEILAKEVK